MSKEIKSERIEEIVDDVYDEITNLMKYVELHHSSGTYHLLAHLLKGYINWPFNEKQSKDQLRFELVAFMQEYQAGKDKQLLQVRSSLLKGRAKTYLSSKGMFKSLAIKKDLKALSKKPIFKDLIDKLIGYYKEPLIDFSTE